MYEITEESYLVDLELYKEDKTLKPLDSNMPDNKITYLNRVFDPEILERDKISTFNFDDIKTKTELVQQGWNYSYLPDSLRISDKGINGSNAIEMNFTREKNKRKLFTPPVAVTKGAEIDLDFKLIDSKSGKNVTEELILSERFKALISFQDICSTAVKVTSTYSITSARSTEDGFFNFPFKLKYNNAVIGRR